MTKTLQHRSCSSRSHGSLRFVLAIVLIVAALGGLTGCGQEETKAELHVYMPSPQDSLRFEIRAEVSGPQSNLYYIWFADTGKCEPQESTAPVTSFQFAEGTSQDWVTAEIWQRGKRIAQTRTEVRLSRFTKPASDSAHPDVQIEITEIPYAEPGGPNTRTNIAGRVIGKIRPEYTVLIYARDAGVWYIQPSSHASHVIGPDHTWSSWTHSGSSYAALVVRSGYPSFRTVDALPLLGGDVLARTIVDGRAK
jgi:hypothetical protein